MPERNNLKGEKVYFGSWFHYSYVTMELICAWQNIMVAGTGSRGGCLSHGSQEAGEKGRVRGQDIASKSVPLSTHSLQL
jgi:hypothetical protein